MTNLLFCTQSGSQLESCHVDYTLYNQLYLRRMNKGWKSLKKLPKETLLYNVGKLKHNLCRFKLFSLSSQIMCCRLYFKLADYNLAKMHLILWACFNKHFWYYWMKFVVAVTANLPHNSNMKSLSFNFHFYAHSLVRNLKSHTKY